LREPLNAVEGTFNEVERFEGTLDFVERFEGFRD
jgi:hypothetical protein